MLNSYLRLSMIVFALMVLLSVPVRTQQQTPEDVARGFYSWYLQIKNGSARETVTLPSGEIDKIRIDLTLIKTASGWRINKVACAD